MTLLAGDQTNDQWSNAKTTYTYDPNGNLLEETNPLGQVTKRTYDSLNRLTSESDAAANGPIIAMTTITISRRSQMRLVASQA